MGYEQKTEGLSTDHTLANRQDITGLLAKWQQGEAEAVQQLFPFLYDKLRLLAGGLMKQERAEHTLQPTALVHEAYLSLAATHRVAWRDRLHFCAVAGKVMRRILVDHARGHAAQKRGGQIPKVAFDDADVIEQGPEDELLFLDQALAELAHMDERKALVIELRWFAGLSVEEIAEHLGVSKPTVILDTRLAKAWLYRFMNGENS